MRFAFSFLLLSALVSISACRKKIVPQRNVFIKDAVPTVRLSHYQSVQKRPGQNPDLAVAMAISGGGSRSYNFAMGVMLGLDLWSASDSSSLLDEVDYFSTVSGGGFAAGAYLQARFDHIFYQKTEAFRLHDYYADQIEPALRRSYAWPVVWGRVNPVMWFSFLDDGDNLEKKIDHQILGYRKRFLRQPEAARSIVLGDLFIDQHDSSQQVQFPMHVANAAITKTAAIFPFSPDILDTFQVSGYTHHLHRIKSAQPIDPYSMPLSVGIKASGSFPVAISNTTLRSNYDPKFRFLHLIDGGLADNLGYYTALNLLLQDQVAKRKVLIVVDADGGGFERSFSKKQASPFSVQVLASLPISGLNARQWLLERELKEGAAKYGIDVIYLRFKSLIEEESVSTPSAIYVRQEQRRLLEMMHAYPQRLLSTADRRILYDVAGAIRTKYQIKNWEQELLTLTGKQVVLYQKEQLDRLLGDK